MDQIQNNKNGREKISPENGLSHHRFLFVSFSHFFVAYGAHSVISENVRFAFLQHTYSLSVFFFFFAFTYAILILHILEQHPRRRTIAQYAMDDEQQKHPYAQRYYVGTNREREKLNKTQIDAGGMSEEDTKAELLFDRCPLNRIYNSVRTYMYLCDYLFSIFFGDVKLNDVA